MRVRILPGAPYGTRLKTKMRNSKLKIQILLIVPFLIALFFSLTPSQVLAGCGGPIVPCGTSTTPPCSFCHIFALLNNIISFVLTCLVPIIAGLMLIIGGFYFLIAGPDPGKINQAKSIIFAVVMGIVVVFAAWVFLNTFLTTIGVSAWTGLDNWWQITCP